jgi:predicted nucleotidyltransferase
MVEQLRRVSPLLIADFCRRYQIRKLAAFGSAVRDDFRPDSDLDLLVEFQPGAVPGLAFFALQDELSAMFGRAVDLNTPNCFSSEFRDRVIASAEVLYVAP